MPEHVPVLVLFSQLIRRLATFLQLCLRGLLVLCVWLVVLPNFTLRMWRFYFWSGENIGFSQTTNETIVPEEIAPSVEQDNSQWTPFIK
jgi:hypothetical protein